MAFIDFIKLARPQQWYKNLLIFLPLVFVGELFNLHALKLSVLGFISLCCASSCNYIINDLIDLQKDREHPEKKERPLAAGRLRWWQAWIEIAVLLFLSFWIALPLGKLFTSTVAFLIIFTQLYSLVLKQELFMDILAIAINFVTRAIAGTFAINVKISPWLVLCTFFLSLYLSVGKRQADVLLLGTKAEHHRATLKYYTKEITQPLLIISTTLLITSYSLYSFLSEHRNLLFTLPFALYVILRYFYLIQTGSEIARHPEKVFKDLRMMIGMLFWSMLTAAILYAPVFFR